MGQGFSYKCNQCDYAIKFMLGVGSLYPKLAEKMLSDMQQGKFGKHFMEAATNASAPSVDFSLNLYRCEKCGALLEGTKIDLFDGDKVILSKRHRCIKCRVDMRIVKGDHGLKCPKCKSELIIKDMLMWD